MIITRILCAALAGLAVTVGGHGAQAATMSVESAPVYSGANGANGFLVLLYDQGAKVALTINQVRIGDDENLGQTQTLDNCGTPIVSGTSVVGYTLTPGQHCFLQSARVNNDSLYGAVVMSDSTKTPTNMMKNVRAMFEMRDGNNNVLTHAELR